MTLALDGTPVSVVRAGGGASSALPGLTTTSFPDIIIVVAEFNGSTTPFGASGVTSANLTFTRRAQSAAAANAIETWWAVSSAPLSSEVITVTFNGTPTFSCEAAFAVSGADTITKWDSHAGIPVQTTTNVDPTISTTNANDFIFGALRLAGTATPTAGAGWTTIANPTNGFLLVEYQIVSAAQTNLTVAVGTGTNNENGSIADAIIQAPALAVFLGQILT